MQRTEHFRTKYPYVDLRLFANSNSIDMAGDALDFALALATDLGIARRHFIFYQRPLAAFPPSHGANNAKVIASILTGKDETLPTMLLDGDGAGTKMATDLKNGLYKSAKERVFTTDKYVGYAGSEIEDLFPARFIAEVVDRPQRQAEVPFEDGLMTGKPIVPQIEAWAKAQSITLEDGWKVDVAREAKRRALAAKEGFDKSILAKWKGLFDDLLAIGTQLVPIRNSDCYFYNRAGGFTVSWSSAFSINAYIA